MNYTYATSEVSISGTVDGDYLLTHLDDGSAESITEQLSGGKPDFRYSYLEHKWLFNIPPGNNMTLHINAWSSISSDQDEFIFAYSLDDLTYSDLVAISNTSDAGHQIFNLPPGVQGSLYVRVKDSNQSIGSVSLDSVFIDHLFVRSENAGGNPPAAPSDLNAAPASPYQIDLSWTDNATDELGFYIERSDAGSAWSLINTVDANTTAYADATVLPNTTYEYRVRAYNASGNSGYSNTANSTTPSGLNLSASSYKVRAEYLVDLNWSGSSASAFDIYRDGFQIAAGFSGDTYTDILGARGLYEYQVCESGSLTECSNIAFVDL